MDGKQGLVAGQQAIEGLDRQLELDAAAKKGGQHGDGDGGDHGDHRQFTDPLGDAGGRGGRGGRSFPLGRTSAMQSISRIKSSGER